MKKILLDIDFGIDREKNPESASNQAIAVNLIAYAVSLGYKQGLESDKRRIWTKMKEELDKAVEKGAKHIEFNSYEMLFLSQAYEKAVVPSGDAVMFTKVESEVLNAVQVEGSEEEKETKKKK